MRRMIPARIRALVKSSIENYFDLKIQKRPPFGTDVFDAVLNLRSWSAGDVIFDVGANDGRSVKRLLHHFPGSSIYAFEPVKKTYQLLRERTDNLDSVQCFQCGLGAETGTDTIHIHPDTSLMNSLSPPYESNGTEEIKITTIDKVMSQHEIDFIHFLKIDTEGHEMEVLKGAQEALLHSRIAIIQVELGFDERVWAYTCLQPVRQYLAPMGYLLHRFCEQRSRPANPPEEWEGKTGDEYQLSVLNRCEAIFIRADLEKTHTPRTY